MSKTPLHLMRLGAGLNREKIAVSVGVSFNTVMRWETGVTTPNAIQAKRLAEAIGCSIGDVITAIEQAKDKGAA